MEKKESVDLKKNELIEDTPRRSFDLSYFRSKYLNRDKKDKKEQEKEKSKKNTPAKIVELPRHSFDISSRNKTEVVESKKEEIVEERSFEPVALTHSEGPQKTSRFDVRASRSLDIQRPAKLAALKTDHSEKSSFKLSKLGGSLGAAFISVFKKEEVDIQNLDQVLDPKLSQWKGVEVNDNPEISSKSLKILIRKGIPDSYRAKVWKAVTGYTEFNKNRPFHYDSVEKAVFGDKIPNKILKIPLFGGALRYEDFHLTEKQKASAARILCCFAQQSEVSHLPLLPDLVCMLLTHLEEPEAYDIVDILHTSSTRSHKVNDEKYRHYFTPSKKNIALYLVTFEEFIKLYVPKIYNKITTLEVSVTQFAEKWFLRCFVGSLPLKTVLRVFDAFLNEGSKTLFRVGLGILKQLKIQLLHCTTAADFLATLEKCTRILVEDDDLMKKAFAVRWDHKKMKEIQKRHQSHLAVAEPASRVYYRPKVSEASQLIKEEEFEILWSWLPDKYCIRDPKLIYATYKDGFSMKYLLDKVGETKPTFIIIKTKKQDILGAFISNTWTKEFFEKFCFVWRFGKEYQKFGWVPGLPDYYIKMTNTTMTIGGEGDNAITIFNLENGRTAECGSFKNPILCAESDFELAELEVYHVC